MSDFGFKPNCPFVFYYIDTSDARVPGQFDPLLISSQLVSKLQSNSKKLFCFSLSLYFFAPSQCPFFPGAWRKKNLNSNYTLSWKQLTFFSHKRISSVIFSSISFHFLQDPSENSIPFSHITIFSGIALWREKIKVRAKCVWGEKIWTLSLTAGGKKREKVNFVLQWKCFSPAGFPWRNRWSVCSTVFFCIWWRDWSQYSPLDFPKMGFTWPTLLVVSCREKNWMCNSLLFKVQPPSIHFILIGTL